MPPVLPQIPRGRIDVKTARGATLKAAAAESHVTIKHPILSGEDRRLIAISRSSVAALAVVTQFPLLGLGSPRLWTKRQA